MNTSVESLRDTIVPKSDQLNADDLIAGPLTVKIAGIKRGDTQEQPVSLSLDGGLQPYKPCKSMRRVMIAAWGDNGHDWVGQSLKLYCDPAVKFGGVKVGGIRISHMTGIPTRMSIMLTTTRSKRSEYVVEPLQNPTPMPENVKQAAAAMKRREKPAAPAASATVTGDPAESDLSDIGATTKPTQQQLDAVAKAFSGIGKDAEQEYGKPFADWTVADVSEAREVFAELRRQASEPAQGQVI